MAQPPQQYQAAYAPMDNYGQGNVYITRQDGAPSMGPPPPPGIPAQWMQKPNPIPGCPVGLEYLTQIDKLAVQQIVELLEAFTGWETNNKYVVRNANGQQVFYAFEKSDTCMRLCCGTQRSFDMNVVDNLNQAVLLIHRDFKCCSGCCWCAGCCDCCAHEVTISGANGEVFGYVKQRGSCWKAQFSIYDADHNKVLEIVGPCCAVNGPLMPCENKFRVLSLDGNEIGKISKVYSGFVREMFTSADNFAVEFPIDLHVKVKSTLLGALFLIDFMFFENKQNNN